MLRLRSSADEYQDGFHILPTVDHAVVTMGVRLSEIQTSILWGKHPEVEMAVSCGSSWVMLKNLQNSSYLLLKPPSKPGVELFGL